LHGGSLEIMLSVS